MRKYENRGVENRILLRERMREDLAGSQDADDQLDEVHFDAPRLAVLSYGAPSRLDLCWEFCRR